MAQFVSSSAHQELYTLVTLPSLILNPLPDLYYSCRRSTRLILLENFEVEIFPKVPDHNTFTAPL